jgi:hypothetical protein
MLAPMEPGGVGSTEPPESGGRGLAAAGSGTTPRSTFEPAGAGAVLGGVTAAGVGAGALVGWAAGSVGLGAVVGAAVGIPAGAFAVYRRYRGFFT